MCVRLHRRRTPARQAWCPGNRVFRRRGLDSLMAFFGIVGLLCLPSLAGKYTEISASYSLGPGETAFGLDVPRYSPADRFGSLTQVQIELETALVGNLEFAGTGLLDSVVDYEVADAIVEALPVDSQALAPPTVRLALRGRQGVDSGESVSIQLRAEGAQSGFTTEPSKLAFFQGEGVVSYSVDFSAEFPSRITASGRGVLALMCDHRVSGRLKVTYFNGPPPAAVDDDLGPVLGTGLVVPIDWFLRNDRSGSGGAVTLESVASKSLSGAPLEVRGEVVVVHAGSGFSGKDGFEYSIRDVEGMRASAWVTFVVIADSGDRSDLASVSILPEGVRLQFPANPGAIYSVEQSDESMAGPWQSLGAAMADGQGWLAFLDAGGSPATTRFYRLSPPRP